MGRSVRRIDDGAVRVELQRGERELLRTLAAQLRPVVAGDAGPELVGRLYPPASDDPETEAAYRELVGDSLVEGRMDLLDTFTGSLAGGTQTGQVWAVELDGDEAAAWLAVVNDARLVLAAVLEVTSEEDWEAGPDPEDPTSVALYYLGWLEEELLAALSRSLD